MYKLISRISESPLCESWIGERGDSTERVFLKIASHTGRLPSALATQYLTASYANQAHLSKTFLNRWSSQIEFNGITFFEVPFLDPELWTQPDLDCLVNSPDLLTNICFAVDYLHQMGLVHADLKVSNFLFENRETTSPVKLCDLEFLQASPALTNGTILGTPGFIAPEILRNEGIYAESDNYSLGASLQALIEDRGSKDTSPEGARDGKLAELATSLTQSSWLRRPRFLLEEVLAKRIINETEFARSIRKLLKAIVFSRLRKVGRSSMTSAETLSHFVEQECKIKGIPDDIYSLLGTAQNPQFRRVLSALIYQGELQKCGDFWAVEADKQLLLDLYALLEGRTSQIGLIGDRAAAAHRTGDALDWSSVVAAERNGRLNQAFVTGSEVLRHASSGQHEGEWRSKSLDLASLAVRCNKLLWAEEILEPLWHSAGGFDTIVAIRYATVLATLGKVEKASQVVKQSLDHISSEGSSHDRFLLRRLHCWLLVARNDCVDAIPAIEELQRDALAAGFRDVVLLSQYTRALAEWRLGNLSVAHKTLNTVEAACISEGYAEILLTTLTSLSLLETTASSYHKATRHARRALELCGELETYANFSKICATCITNYTRLGQIDVATNWLEKYLSRSGDAYAPNELATYLQGQAFVMHCKGQYQKSIDAGLAALKVPGLEAFKRLKADTHALLARTASETGRHEDFHSHANEAEFIYAQLGDKVGLAELALIQCNHELLYSENAPSVTPVELAETAKSLGVTFQATYTLLATVFTDKHNQRLQALTAVARWRSDLDRTAPLFDIAAWLSEQSESNPDRSQEFVVAAKRAFSAFSEQRHLLLACLAAKWISNQYAERRLHAPAEAFLNQALIAAEGLGNSVLIKQISDRIEVIRNGRSPVSSASSVLKSISDLLAHKQSVTQLSGSLLTFAIEQCGAERGVILVLKGRPGKLVTIASANCDDSSIRDVEDFSTSIVANTLSALQPTVVHDAQTDRRTRRLRSIVLHNVRSIIALPLVSEGKTLGVLYLDHHTIPSLFSDSDLELVISVANFLAVAIGNANTADILQRSHHELSNDHSNSGREFLTRDSGVLKLLERIHMYAQSDAPVLILGESGTGKEILCELIHKYSYRAAGPLVKLNCAAIQESMIESELFGVGRRVATGVDPRSGRIAAADGGTLFLDEIGDMPANIQAKVLRVIEDGEVCPVGNTRSLRVDIRIIAATNRDLRQAMSTGAFRSDLYHRISTFELKIPSLRDRPSDLELLLDHYAVFYAKGRNKVRFSLNATSLLKRYSWPGNVRELKNFVERLSVYYPGQQIDVDMLPAEVIADAHVDAPGNEISQDANREIFLSALQAAGWNISKAARRVGVPNTTFRRKMSLLKISRPPRRQT